MKNASIRFLTIMFLAAAIVSSRAATRVPRSYGGMTPVAVVENYLTHLKSYSSFGKIADRKALDKITPSNCLVNDAVAQYISKTEGWPMATMSIASYHNAFNRWGKAKNLSYEIGDLIYLRQFVTPGKMSVFGDTLHVVCGTLRMKKPVKLTDKILFFVRRNKVTKIISPGDGETIGLALEHYTNQRFDSAFAIMRQLAYRDRTNYAAQYWTAVMELQGVGCADVDPVVRKQEALWWLNRGEIHRERSLRELWLSYNDRNDTELCFADYVDLYGQPIMELKMPEAWSQMKQLREEMKLTYADVNLGLWDGYKEVIADFPPMNCDLLLMANQKNRLGYVDRHNKWVIKPRYTAAWPFAPDGLACVGDQSGKHGFIDTKGRTVIPVEYDKLTPRFMGDVAFGIKGGNLCIIDKNNRLLCSLSGFEDPDRYRFVLLDKYVVVFSNATGLGRMFDRYGNLTERDINEVRREPNGYVTVIRGAKEIYRFYERW